MTVEDQTNKPLVTVITPTYNRADLLEETIDSVLSQDYENFEYIVLDDGSKDDTVELLKRYNDPRLKWQSHTNMGVIRTVNKGFKLGNGSFFTVVNSDDPLLPNHIIEMVAFLTENPEIIGAYPDWMRIDNHSNKINQVNVKEYDYVKALRDYECYQGPGTMFRREAFDLVDLYDEAFPTFFDYEFYMRLGMYKDFKRLPKTLATYRSHDGTITTQASGKIGREYIGLMDKLYSIADMPIAGRQVKMRVYASAHYLTGRMLRADYRQAAHHFIRSIMLRPIGCTPGGNSRAWRLMLYVIFLAILPRRVAQILEGFSRNIRQSMRVPKDKHVTGQN